MKSILKNTAKFVLYTVILMTCTMGVSQVITVDEKISVKEELIPSYFDGGDRIYFLLETINNKKIKAYTDTGGGWTMLYPWTIKKIGLDQHIVMDSLSQRAYILAKNVFKDDNLHPFLTQSQQTVYKESFFSIPPEKMLLSMGESILEEEAFLGQYFFMNHSWKFDYLNKKVLRIDNADLNERDLNVQRIGFKKDTDGNKLFGHPSMTIYVDGEEIPVLFDTGATFHLSDSAQLKLSKKRQIGGSFIARSVYNQWKENHPEWEIIKEGDQVPNGNRTFKMDMIKVPEITVGNQEIGPVWFSVRPDEAWSKGMIRTMDKIVKGALGGSALKYLSVTIDYPNELIKFEK